MPFFIASAITFYGVVKAQEAGVNSKSALLSNVSGDDLLMTSRAAPEALANVREAVLVYTDILTFSPSLLTAQEPLR
jgi:hypothetical protein